MVWNWWNLNLNQMATIIKIELSYFLVGFIVLNSILSGLFKITHLIQNRCEFGKLAYRACLICIVKIVLNVLLNVQKLILSCIFDSGC